MGERLLGGTWRLRNHDLWFERADGPIPPQRWRANAMAAVTVHDLPPTLGYLAGDHVALREELGLLTRSVDVEWAEHANEIASWRCPRTRRFAAARRR